MKGFAVKDFALKGNMMNDDTLPPRRIAVSACTLGNKVRYNGGHKWNLFVAELEEMGFELIPLCPEVEMGMPVPRETLRLRRQGEGTALVTSRSGEDYSARMSAYAAEKIESLKALGLSGIVVQGGSPSCGMERVKLYPEGEGAPTKSAAGAFTRELMAAMPLMPIEESGRLHDNALREDFHERLLAHYRLKAFFSRPWHMRDLVSFHAREKLLLMAHGDYRPLGQLVARAKGLPKDEVAAEYSRLFMEMLHTRSLQRRRVGRHVNVLEHIAGYFRGPLDEESRGELHGLIRDYREGLVTRIVPLTLIRHHARHLKVRYLQEQSYLQPLPLRSVRDV